MSIYEEDPELSRLLAYFDELVNERPTFDSFMNLTDESPSLDKAVIKFENRDDFVGNAVYRTLHGGFISAVLDNAGGAAVFLSSYKQLKGQPFETQIKKLSKNATIDLRVDYLRPGVGKEFTAEGWILRKGNKVAVTRMELRNDEGALIAVGTGTYSVG
ncbi:MAG: thioesterase family protein [Dehalococcoidia bacterium]